MNTCKISIHSRINNHITQIESSILFTSFRFHGKLTFNFTVDYQELTVFHKSILDRSDTQLKSYCGKWKICTVSCWLGFGRDAVNSTYSKTLGVPPFVIALLRINAETFLAYELSRIHKTVLKSSVWTLLRSKILIGMQIPYRDKMKWKSSLSIWHNHTLPNEMNGWFKGVETGSLESA